MSWLLPGVLVGGCAPAPARVVRVWGLLPLSALLAPSFLTTHTHLRCEHVWVIRNRGSNKKGVFGRERGRRRMWVKAGGLLCLEIK